MVYLGIDFGEKRIGLALFLGKVIEPYKIIETKNWKEILDICQKENVDKIILGFSKGRLEGRIKRFGEILRRASQLPVEYHDETLTSREAVKLMVEIGKPKLKRRKKDAIAAALILESYLSL